MSVIDNCLTKYFPNYDRLNTESRDPTLTLRPRTNKFAPTKEAKD